MEVSMKKDVKLKVQRFSQGIILPRKMEINAPMWGLGGVCDKDNNFVQSSFYDGGWAKHGGGYTWEDEEYIDEDVVYVGMFYSHWGHFLIDLTGRMWYLPLLKKETIKFKVAYLGEEEPQGNNLEFFKLLGIQPEQLIHITKPTRCRNVIVPEQSFKSCEWYTDEFRTMFDDMVDSVLSRNDEFKQLEHLKKVYFTRRNFSKAQNTEFGEEYFQQCFIKNGFQAIAPETLSLCEQIYVWNHAEEIVCINGTIPLNVVFCKNPNLKLVVLNKTSIFHENPLILLKMRDVTAIFLDIYREPLRGYPKSLGEGPYLLWPCESFENYWKQKKYVMPFSDSQKKKYFRSQQVKYYFCILGIRRKLRFMISKLVPEVLKEKRRRFMVKG